MLHLHSKKHLKKHLLVGEVFCLAAHRACLHNVLDGSGCPIFFKCPLDNFAPYEFRHSLPTQNGGRIIYNISESRGVQHLTKLTTEATSDHSCQAASTAVSESDGRILDGVSIRFFECCRRHWMSSSKATAKQSEARSNCGTFEIPLDLSEVGEAPETNNEGWRI